MSRTTAARRRVSHRFRFPIALRFAVLFAATSIAILSWQASRAIEISGARLEREINERGMQLASTIAALVPPAWLDDLRHQRELVELLGEVRDSSTEREILNIIVFDRRDGAVALLANVLVSPGEPVHYPPAVAQGVTITEHTADGVPVRNFSAPIRAPAVVAADSAKEPSAEPVVAPSRERSGRVELLLSIRHIQEARLALSRALSRASWAGALAAAALALVLGAFLTRSVRKLARDIRTVGQGNLEHESQIDSADEIGDLARALNRMTANLREAERDKIARKALEHELGIASKIQKRLLPVERPVVSGLDIAVHWKPAKEVGGDYFDFVPVDSGHVGIVVADVSGKGVPGSLVMTMTRSLLRMAAIENPEPCDTLIEVDRAIAPDLRPGLFITATYLVLEKATLEIRLARAGHNAPLLWLAHERKMHRLETAGVAIGLDRGAGLLARELREERFRLRPGDALVLHTDGVTEAKNANDEEYGNERLARIVVAQANARKGATAIAAAVLKDLEQHRGGREISDDTTLLVLVGRESNEPEAPQEPNA